MVAKRRSRRPSLQQIPIPGNEHEASRRSLAIRRWFFMDCIAWEVGIGCWGWLSVGESVLYKYRFGAETSCVDGCCCSGVVVKIIKNGDLVLEQTSPHSRDDSSRGPRDEPPPPPRRRLRCATLDAILEFEPVQESADQQQQKWHRDWRHFRSMSCHHQKAPVGQPFTRRDKPRRRDRLPIGRLCRPPGTFKFKVWPISQFESLVEHGGLPPRRSGLGAPQSTLPCPQMVGVR
jgi:hypothetical protein